MINDSFSSTLPYFCLFIISLWLSGTLFEELLRCRLIGELLVGLLFGNLSVGTLLPTDKTVFILAGEVGVLGLVFQAGLETDIRLVLKSGLRASVVALIGIVIPLATGFGFIYGLSQQHHIQEMMALDNTPDSSNSHVAIEALASGASLASTSIAIAVTMMKQQAILDTAVGTLITTAAMLDDVVSLILLGIVSSIGASHSSVSEESDSSGIRPMTVIQPVLASLGIILVGIVGCATVAKIRTRRRQTSTVNISQLKNAEFSSAEIAQREDEGINNGTDNHTDISVAVGKESRADKSRCHQQIKDRVSSFYSRVGPTIQLAGMIIVGLGYSILAEYLGSSRLLGAFVAGVFFSTFEDLCLLYETQVALKLQPVMSAVFFASIGFEIPLTQILNPVLFGWGIVYALIATLSKLPVMIAVPERMPSPQEIGVTTEGDNVVLKTNQPNARWMVGTAMIARGELGLLISQQARIQGVMSQTVMVVTTWSIVLATLFGVGAFGATMNGKLKK